MVKSTRGGEKLRGSLRLASPTSTRVREEEQADFVSPPCSPEPMKGDTSVDPTKRPNSKFMVPSQQPALTVVASAAAEDPGSRLFTPAIAPEDQVVRIKSTSLSIDKSIAVSSSTLHSSIYVNIPQTHQPEDPYIPPMNLPSPERSTGEELNSPPPAASTDPQKTDAAPSAAASPTWNHRGSDGPTRNARESKWDKRLSDGQHERSDTWYHNSTSQYARRDTWPRDFKERRSFPGMRPFKVARDNQYARGGTW